MEQDNRITELTFKYTSGEITPEELAELWAYLNAAPDRMERFERRIDPETAKGRVRLLQQWQTAKEKSKEKTLSIVALDKVTRFQVWKRMLVAASILLFVGGFAVYRMNRDKIEPLQKAAVQRNILPGGQRATLTLSGGMEIVLDSLEKGEVTEDAGSKIVKATNGRISYISLKEEKPNSRVEEISFNTLKTPKGGMYEIVLPDHSRAFLNSASSLKYPTVFPSHGPREVELTGEAYFVVHTDPAKPFRVSVHGKTVEALGTIFNVNAYDDEPSVEATLLEGSVRVSDSAQTVLLRPGQQAQLAASRIEVVNEVDTESVVAWKNGDFRFIGGVPLEEVLRQLSRWYNVEVVYKGDKPRQKFFGVVSRNLPASEVFRALERSGYHVTMVDNKVEVSQ